MRVTIKDIAQALSISHSTVSRVLNDKQTTLVSEATRHRILEAASRMGYRPSRIAQALQGKSTQLIGVLVPDEDDHFFQAMIRDLRHTLEESEYELMVFTSSPTQIAEKWQRLLQWDVDGIFVFDYMFYVDGLRKAITHHAGAVPPVVGLLSNQTELRDYVTVDFAPALTELLTQQYKQGCRQFGYLAPRASFHSSEQRYAVFSEFMRQHELTQIDIAVPHEERTLLEAAWRGLSAWIKNGNPLPDALFCQNDELAMGAARALREAGIAVPDRVVLTGCDGLPYISYLESPFTSLSLPVRDICRQGWNILQQRIAEPDGPPLQMVLQANILWRVPCFGGETSHLSGQRAGSAHR